MYICNLWSSNRNLDHLMARQVERGGIVLGGVQILARAHRKRKGMAAKTSLFRGTSTAGGVHGPLRTAPCDDLVAHSAPAEVSKRA